MSIIGKRIVVTGADYEDIAINRTTTRSITVDVTNGTYQGPETIEEGAIATVTITADTGYSLPREITVTGASYVYNRNTGVITLSNPTDDVAIAVVCTEIHIYTITVNVENGTYQAPETITEGTSVNVTISPNTDYFLPSTITVTGAGYTYNNTTGVIVLSNPTDNVVIAATCARPVVYTITTNVTNGTYQGAGTITEGTTENITITPDTDYYLPNSVAVTGATYVYDEETGVITLSNPTDNVAITVVCTDIKPEPLPTLVQGYWSSAGDILPNRVCNETLIQGIQTITTKPGYVIRAVYAYTQEFTFPQIGRNILQPYYAVPNGMEATTSTTRTTYTTLNANYYYGVTFAKTDASANILPTEDIVDSWEFSE